MIGARTPVHHVPVATKLTILRHARKIVATSWTHGGEAVDKAGYTTYFDSDSAVAWCAVGAIKKADANVPDDGTPQWLRLDVICGELLHTVDVGWTEYPGVRSWNDSFGRTQKQVVAAFDATIARLDKTEQ